ncbi:MAG: hypothetical protein ABIH23_29840 [bacterium]
MVKRIRKKAKMGRPPKPVAEKQGARVIVNMTKAEKRQLEKEAKAAELSLSAYLLECWRKKGK